MQSVSSMSYDDNHYTTVTFINNIYIYIYYIYIYMCVCVCVCACVCVCVCKMNFYSALLKVVLWITQSSDWNKRKRVYSSLFIEWNVWPNHKKLNKWAVQRQDRISLLVSDIGEPDKYIYTEITIHFIFVLIFVQVLLFAWMGEHQVTASIAISLKNVY